MKIISFLCILIAFFLASCANKESASFTGYDSLKQCRKAAKVRAEVETKIALKEESKNWIFYSYDQIIHNHINNIDTTCKYDPSTKKWNYDLSGSIEINYVYKHGILDMPGNWPTIAMWTGNSRNERIPIKYSSYQTTN